MEALKQIAELQSKHIRLERQHAFLEKQLQDQTYIITGLIRILSKINGQTSKTGVKILKERSA